MARIRSDLQIEKGLPTGNKVLAKPDGQTEVVQIEPYRVSPTTWVVDSAGIYENVPGQFEIPSLLYAKDVDTAIDTDGKVYKYNQAGGYFELAVDLSGSITALQPGDNVSELNNDAGYVDATGAANAAPVQSVNGDIGNVVLDADDVGAIDVSEKGINNGVATLDGGGKIPAGQLPNSVMTLEGQWDASTNTPTLSDGTGNAGMVYEVTVGGTQDLGSGNITFNVGDFVVYGNDGKWYRSINSNEVVSVNGQTGVVLIGFNHLTSHPTTLSGYGILDAATAAQGAKADTALQPGDLATVATTGVSTDLTDSADIIRNNTDTFTSEAKINQIVTLTQAEYDAIPSPDPNTLYLIPEP